MKTLKEPKVKLTLTVRKSIIQAAKEYATLDEISLSSLVEDYLSEYLTKRKTGNEAKNLPDQLFGFAKDSPLSSKTDEEIRALWVKDKFNL